MLVSNTGNYPRIAEGAGGQKLRQALARLDTGQTDWDGVQKVQGEVVREVIDEQIQAGVDLVTDGLVSWDDAVTYLARGLGGFELQGMVRFLDTNTFYRQPLARERVEWRGPITVKDWQFAASVSGKPVKAVLTGPYSLGRLSRTAVHDDPDDLVLELADALRQEVDALHAAGAPLIQIDEPLITRRAGDVRLTPGGSHGDDWPVFEAAMQRLTRNIHGRLALNASFGSVAHLDGFFGLPFQVFQLDFVQGPANWDILDRVPADREVVFGIVDAREVRLEEASELAAALERGARFVEPECMHVAPNCGLEFLPRESARAKLHRAAEGARIFGTRGSRPVAHG